MDRHYVESAASKLGLLERCMHAYVQLASMYCTMMDAGDAH